MSSPAVPHIRRWTRDEYAKMIEVGLFVRQHVELLEGQVITMSPMGSPHATAVALAAHAVTDLFGPAYFVRWQMPFDAGEFSQPEPDVAVVPGQVRDYRTSHPRTAALLIEVADASLTYDRTEKASVYAKAGVPEYWIINVVDRRLEVYRTPIPDGRAAFGFRYADTLVLTPNDHIAPLGQPTASVAVADLLP